ncbi:MATE family efflux transporter [Pseudoflavonifractor sp. AF19-9AC]|nr:MATE family efflux transporter [Pseudoflavonifractor sp. AF19-9AC]
MQLHHHTKFHPDQRKRMLETPVPRLILTLAVPTIVSMMITSIYNMADTYFVSQINTSASGAVGIVFSVMAIIQAVGFTIGMGVGSVSSRLLGQNHGQQAAEYASSAVVTAIACGSALAALGLAFLDKLVWLLGATPTIYPYALDYATYILMGAPVMCVAFSLNNLLRWQGKANRSVIGLGTGGILNMVLDPIFIFGLDLGIGGAGLATLLSQCVSMCILASFFLLGQSDIKVSPRCISRSPRTYLTIFASGMPSFFRQGMSSLSTVSLNFNAGVYGDAAVAAMAIVTKVFNFLLSAIIGFGQGMQPVVGYNYGAGRYDRVKQAALFSIRFCTVILTVMAALGAVFAPQIVAFFRDDPQVIDIGTRAFRYQCITLPLGAVLVFANMLFQSVGKYWRASLLAVSRQGLFFIPLVFLLPAKFGLTGLELTQATSDLIAFVVSASMLLYYFLREFRREEQGIGRT